MPSWHAVASDLPPAAVKTGMLATAGLVKRVASAIGAHGLPNLVVDPVMGGHSAETGCWRRWRRPPSPGSSFLAGHPGHPEPS